ncbi:hypothetical protein ACFLUC_02090 [Chloroflexota bacterium]
MIQDLRIPIWVLAFSILNTILISGCVSLIDPEASQDFHAELVGNVDENNTIGQTIQSRRPRFSGIQLWLRNDSNSEINGESITVELYHQPSDQFPINTILLSQESIENNYPITISFPTLKDPANQNYFLVLKSTGSSVQVYGRNEDVHLAGRAFVNGKPVEAEIGYRLSYDYDLSAVLEDLEVLFGQWYLVIPLIAIIWLPGRILYTFLERGSKKSRKIQFDWGERTAISIGISLAIIPLVMLWTTTIGFTWSRTNVMLVFSFLIFLYLVMQRKQRTNVSEWITADHIRDNIIGILLFLLFLLSLFVRLVMVRDMAAPAWVDSVHHALITRLIIENGSLPATYVPFIDSNSSSYHPGFHIITAVFQWLSNLSIPDAMLIFGQVLNASIVFTAYLFTTTLTENRVAGVIAALIAGLYTPMPAYYTSWGRYTQLTGLLIFPAALEIIQILVHKPGIEFHKIRWPILIKEYLFALLLTGIVWAGLFLTHYRVFVFLVCLFLVWLFIDFFKKPFKMRPWNYIMRSIILLIPLGVLILLLTLPWWPEFIKTLLYPMYTFSRGKVPIFEDFSWKYLLPASGIYVTGLAMLGLIWSFIWAKRFAATLLLWICILFILANLGALGLPGASFVNNTSVLIILFLPISALCGYLLSWVIVRWDQVVSNQWTPIYRISIIFAGILLTILATRAILPILNPNTMLFRESDKNAINWIKENISPDEIILINPFSWGYGLYAGIDGGFWITPSASQKTIPPPVLYAIGGVSDQSRDLPDISRQVLEKSQNPTELYAYLKSKEIEIIYLGARGGALSPKLLLESELFQELYSEDGTWVISLIPAE